ncbi:carboxynorspermidine decarboxylase [Butyrivibrio sp. MC2021]|uniref:carboxynorspermidine decarboxylase n=1 Tax=Butyrivibrio sp. MC2021 TaxID=1408306 RepID=UPI00047C5763|nr:carboxynorspermidine decarboxylase [Butyrivibrio sp. MC2021]
MKLSEVKTPVYVIDEKKLRKNCEILADVQKRSGAKILLAQKAYSVYQTYPLIAKYLSGCTASGIFEAKLAHEEFITPEGERRENHVYEPAFKDDEMAEICNICDHVVFNSLRQLEHHRPVWGPKAAAGQLSVGIRINPEFSTDDAHEIYDPCASGSRLGIRKVNLPDKLPEGVEGIHFHNLCEQDFEPLFDTFKKVEKDFASYFPEKEHLYSEGEVPAGNQLKWINLGGGHHITRDDYDREGLIELVKYIKSTYGLEVYLEPGEAIALYAGYLVTTVMDIVETDRKPVLILDTSASCHMPDVIEMPYVPPLKDAEDPGELPYTYRLSSRTCLAGDIIGDYSFEKEKKIGDRLYFEDMAIYSMVKNNTFNGMPLPDIAIMHDKSDVELIREFGYNDFKMRL